VQALLLARGRAVTHAAIRPWCCQCGQAYAHELRRRRPWPGDTWPRDEALLPINGKRHSLWQAVEQDDNLLDRLGQSRRNQPAAQKCFRQWLKGLTSVLRVVMTAKLKRSGAARREVLRRDERLRLNNLTKSARRHRNPTDAVSDNGQSAKI
jgi:putative transposase